MNLTRVGVLRGGPSSEYDVSLKTGANVLDALRTKYPATYAAHDILIDKQGQWHLDGMPFKPQDVLPRIDVAFIALHGAYGEDGKLQHFLEAHGMPFTGSGALASAVGMNKSLSKQAFTHHGIKTPYGKEVSSAKIFENAHETAQELFVSFPIPAIVKPVSSGSSVGVSRVQTLIELEKALISAAQHGDAVLLEECIEGIEATCGVIEGFRGEELYALPPVEIRTSNAFFDYEAKYAGGKSQEIVPASFASHIKESLHDLARKVHKAVGLRHYSRTDFIIHPKRGIYVLEVNTLPGLTNESLVPKSLRAVGSDTHELVDHVIRLAMER